MNFFDSRDSGSRKSSKRITRSRSSFLMRLIGIECEESGTLKGKRRFKATVKRVIWSLSWIKEIQAEEGEIAQIASRARTKKGIPKEAKKILIKYPIARTKEESDELVGMLNGLYFYNRYPKKEYEQLIKSTMFASYGPGRVILRQGHMVNLVSKLYYIVHGHLSVEVETVDPITLVATSEMTKKLGPGDFFGEVSILFNDVRESTITSISMVELLCITKEDFDNILKESLEKEWSKVLNALLDLPYFFGDWTELELRRCSIISQLKQFKDGDLILGDGYGRVRKAHFIVCGRCVIIQNMVVEKLNGKYKLFHQSKLDTNHNTEKNTEEIYMQTCVFSKGACFGIGEKREHRRYIAETDDVVCLMVPQYLLMSHKRFDGYRQFLESRLFTEEELFRSFIYSRKRLAYRKKVLKSIPSRAPLINDTTIWDVPLYYRVFAPQIGAFKVPDDIMMKALKFV